MICETVNLHVWGKCNLHCGYCYGTFPERPTALPLASWCRILDELRLREVVRVTFSGGEPTLHPDLLGMIEHARAIGLQTSIITNGARLSDEMLRGLESVGLTLDADDDALLVRIGRGLPAGRSYLEHTRETVRRAKRAGCIVKINTVVTAINAGLDLTAEILALAPYKWKALQFTYVPGENDAEAENLRISEDEFRAFVERHGAVAASGIWVEAESASVVSKTYVMIDPLGRVFQHASGGHRVSRPVLEVGLDVALREAGGYDREAFVQRGGHVDVRSLIRRRVS
jgi:radical S-adenosyl methionine domain-containing protein 2